MSHKRQSLSHPLSVRAVTEKVTLSYPPLHALQQALNETGARSAWLREPLTAGVVMAVCLLGNGCGPKEPEMPPLTVAQPQAQEFGPPPPPPGWYVETPFPLELTVPEADRALIAPLFFHGRGQGAVGCVVMTPPLFMTEEEALDIILSELNRAGYRFTRDEFLLEGIMTRERKVAYSEDTDDESIEMGVEHPFFFDLFDVQHGVGIKFVSRHNQVALGGIQDGGTIQYYDFIDLAQTIREQLFGRQNYKVGVFYDPVADEARSYADQGRKRATESESLLQRQVQDFVLWLRQSQQQEGKGL